MTTTSPLLAPSWQDIHTLAQKLARRLAAKGSYTGLVAIARGGLIPAGLLAGILDIRLVETVCLTSYDGRRQGDLRVLKAMEGDGEGWLVIDDLADSGATFAAVRTMLPAAHRAALYVKPNGQAQVDTWAEEAAQETWVQFPWEMV